MPVKKEPNGRRSVEAEVEVPGTPDQVWQAIATGPGISSWFVPSTVDGRLGGAVTSSFGPGMDSTGTITTWEPPHRYVVGQSEEPGVLATEWTVEARAGGTCRVRVVHSWFASTDEWDQQYEGTSYGWLAFFKILDLFLAHFNGEPATLIQLSAMSPASVPDAWRQLVAPLGLVDATLGATVASPAGAPDFHGIVESVNPPDWPGLILRLDRPAPAVAHLFAMPIGGMVLLSLRLYLYGPTGPAAAPQVEAAWQAWLTQHFPPPTA